MLSRVADSLYWIGRYSERTETNAHIISTQLDRMIENSADHTNYEIEWSTILKITGYYDDYKSRYDGYYLQKMLQYVLSDKNNFNSIKSTISSIRSNARNTRDILPNELWEEWNDLYLSIQSNPTRVYTIIGTNDFLNQVRKTSLTSSGVIETLMSRGEHYLFLTIGKWLERAEKTAIIISELLEKEEQLTSDFSATFSLRLTHSFEEYTRRTRDRSATKVLNFLIGDLKSSRSIAYCIEKIKQSILEVENNRLEPYAVEMFNAIEQLEEMLHVDASTLTLASCKKWVEDIREQCTNFGPIFCKTYYMTPPILVE